MAQRRNGRRVRRDKSLEQLPRNLAITLVCAVIVSIILIALSKHLFPAGSETSDSSPSVSQSQTADSSTISNDPAEADESPPPEESEAVEESPEPEVTTVTVSCVGDCTLGTDEYFNVEMNLPTMAEKMGLSYFLSNVKDIFESDDLTIVNFEGTLTTSTTRADKKYAFKGDPSYTEILTSSSVEACNLANNHSHDYGADSYTDTKTYLEEAGLLTFGYDNVAITEVNGMRVALVGVYELAKGEGCLEDLESAMATAKDEDADLIIVSFHWGIERDAVPDATQVKLAHAAVDLGANLVVGHHPHVLQGIEEYNGVNILYSLGNFCFGGNRNPEDKDTMIYQQTFTFVDGELQVGIDDTIIPCSLSSVTERNDYCPTPATGDEAQRILDKIAERSAAIG